ncbi:uncharacterized [Tachysurus ichikawai]
MRTGRYTESCRVIVYSTNSPMKQDTVGEMSCLSPGSDPQYPLILSALRRRLNPQFVSFPLTSSRKTPARESQAPGNPAP